jgi:hypothetical protein
LILRSKNRLVLEAEMCATSERKRCQRANRNGEPLDQLHGTSLLASSELSHIRTMWHSLACLTPIWGTPGLTIGVPLMGLKPQMSPTVLAVGAQRNCRAAPPHPIGWFRR